MQQENLTEQFTVAESIFMGRQLMKNRFQVDWRRMYDEAQKLLDDLGVAVNAHQLVRDLGVAQKQMVEVVKALSINSKVLILDEPTAPLTNREIDTLFDTIRMLKSRGVSMIYISHRLEEVMEICDRATIMCDGANVTALNVADTKLDEIIRYMVGRELKEKFPKIQTTPGRERLRVEDTHAGKQVNGVSLSARGGEGLVLPLPISQNMTLATLDKFGTSLHLNLGQEKATVNEYIGKLNIKTPSMQQPARNLSGGNQQKVVLAKWLLSDSKVIIFDEPTRGIDVGVKIEVYNIINDLIRQGVAVIMISSELPETLGMSDRVAVIIDVIRRKASQSAK